MGHVFSSINQVPLFRYGLIMADPPWTFENWSKAGSRKNASDQYDCQSLEWVKSLPVGELAVPDCVLWLWVFDLLGRVWCLVFDHSDVCPVTVFEARGETATHPELGGGKSIWRL